jgi:hypothetical protein
MINNGHRNDEYRASKRSTASTGMMNCGIRLINSGDKNGQQPQKNRGENSGKTRKTGRTLVRNSG